MLIPGQGPLSTLSRRPFSVKADTGTNDRSPVSDIEVMPQAPLIARY